MTKRQFVVIAFRLFALYMLFNFISTIGYLFIRPGPRDAINYYLAPVFDILICLTVISLIWRKSEWLMQKIFAISAFSNDNIADEESQASKGEASGGFENTTEIIEAQNYYETPVSTQSLELVVFSVVGLAGAFSEFPTLVRELGMGMFRSISEVMFPLSSVIKVVLGVWLFLRPWQFQGWIEKFKRKDDSSEEGHPTAP